MPATDPQIATLVDGWVGLAELQSYRDIKTEQAPPWATISQGASGNAYALWHIANRRTTRAPLATAQRWWRAATRGAERRSGLRSKVFDRTPITASVPFGRHGLHVVEALVAHDLGAPKPRRRALDRLAAALRRGGVAPTEYMLGRAGGLTAAVHVHRHTGDAALLDVAGTLADRLLAEPPMPTNGFAHGHAGVQHALLAWSEYTKTALPSDFAARIVHPTHAEIIARAPTLAATWCNGLVGFVMLWTKAYELTGDEVWRTRARDCAIAAATFSEPVGTLCCGLGGQAYALLALSRIDATEDWRARATQCLLGGLSAEIGSHGLFRGLPGLVCLAADLTTPGAIRFPLVEP